MGGDDGFNFERRDVFAAPAKAVRLAINEGDEPVGVHPAQVAGVVPISARCGERFIRTPPVAVVHRTGNPRPDRDLSHLTGWHLAVQLIQYRNLVPRRGPACCSWFTGSPDHTDTAEGDLGLPIHLAQ